MADNETIKTLITIIDKQKLKEETEASVVVKEKAEEEDSQKVKVGLEDNNSNAPNSKADLQQPKHKSQAPMNTSQSSQSTSSSPNLDNYLNDLEKVVQWLLSSEELLSQQGSVGDDVNSVKQQFQTHEVISVSTDFFNF